ncbi:Os02g0645850 [Oryza sativa Japonica Group]|uniref:Os02g0645850 protein n=1 Tax=Oryza sativa subsp. japonica TaxID=39947 RepID=A0A0N7KFS4_ORYSJ|nr:Os02g0645850 [Oryza sativa Japonica Group]
MQDTGAGRSRRRHSNSVRVGTVTRGPRPHPCAGRGEVTTLPAAARHDGGTPDEGGDPATAVEAVTNMSGEAVFVGMPVCV